MGDYAKLLWVMGYLGRVCGVTTAEGGSIRGTCIVSQIWTIMKNAVYTVLALSLLFCNGIAGSDK